MFRYANCLVAALVLLAGVAGCQSGNPCGGGGCCGGGYGGCDTCGGGCDTCGGGCDTCGGGCCGGSSYSSWYPWNWFSHGGEEYPGCSCGETYWGDHDCDCGPCDQCGNYVGYGQAGVAYQQAGMYDQYAAAHGKPAPNNTYANNRARPMPYPQMNQPTLARQPRMMPAPTQDQFEDDSQFAQQPQYMPPQRYAPQPNYTAARYAQQPPARQPQYAQRSGSAAPPPQPRSVRVYSRPEGQFNARSGSRDEGDAPSVSSSQPRSPKLKPYIEPSAVPASAIQDDHRASRASYDALLAPKSKQASSSKEKDPWAWMYAD